MTKIILLVAVTFLPSFVWAELQSCGQVKKIEGSDCKSLRVEFDLSECGDAQGSFQSKMICKKAGTTAELKTQSNKFRVALERSHGEWKPSGKIWRFPLAKEREVSNSKSEVAVLPVIPESLAVAAAEGVSVTEAASGKAVSEKTTEPKSEPKVDAKEIASEATLSNPMIKPTSIDAPSETAPALGDIKVSGFIDAYYSQNMNGAAPAQHTGNPATIPNGNTSLRYYDQYNDQIQLSLAEITIKKENERMGFLVDLDFGTSADINAANPAYSASASTADVRTDEMSKHIGQAIATYKPKSTRLVFDIGKMATHVGLETMKSKDNWNYSRSTLYGYGIPLWHSGAHLGLEVAPQTVWLGAYVYNGWNSMYENNHAKTFGGQIKFAANDSAVMVLNYLEGAERNMDNTHLRRIYEGNLTVKLVPTLSFQTDWLGGNEDNVLNNSTGERRMVSWKAHTLALKWSPSSCYSLSPRYEFYEDLDGYTFGGYGTTGEAQNLTSWTVTNAFTLSPGTELRFEWRQDQSTKANRFVKENFDTTNEQITYTAAFLSSF